MRLYSYEDQPVLPAVAVCVNDRRATMLGDVLQVSLRDLKGGPWHVTIRPQPHDPTRWGLELFAGGRGVLTLVRCDDPPGVVAARVRQLLSEPREARAIV
jgi:hypothetical protein